MKLEQKKPKVWFIKIQANNQQIGIAKRNVSYNDDPVEKNIQCETCIQQTQPT